MTLWRTALCAGSIAAAAAAARVASATSSELLCYKTSTASICLSWNGPFEIACQSIFDGANRRMPLYLGLEKEAALRGRRFAVIDGYGYRPEMSVDGNPVSLAGWDKSSELSQILTEVLGFEAPPRYVVPVFSIQLDLLPPRRDPRPFVRAWEERVPFPPNDLGLLSHEGDCDLQPFWTHTYADGTIGIRYGVFDTYSAAWKAVTFLQWAPHQPQIVKTRLRADSLNVYFGK